MSLFKRQPPPRREPVVGTSRLGVARVGEVLLPIVEVRLEESSVVVLCQKDGPVPADSGPVRFFGRDGTPITEQDNDGDIAIPNVETGAILNMRFAMSIQKTSGPHSVNWS